MAVITAREADVITDHPAIAAAVPATAVTRRRPRTMLRCCSVSRTNTAGSTLGPFMPARTSRPSGSVDQRHHTAQQPGHAER